MDELVAYGSRYAKVLGRKRLGFTAPRTVEDLRVIEHLSGGATTDFGAPSVAAKWESSEVDPQELKRLLSILESCWAAFDGAHARASGVRLMSGPRGGPGTPNHERLWSKP